MGAGAASDPGPGTAAPRGDGLRRLGTGDAEIEQAGCQRSGAADPPDRAADRRDAAKPAAAAIRRHAGRARFWATRLGATRLGATRLGATRLGSARLGSARLRTTRLWSARLGSIRPGSIRARQSRPELRDAIRPAAIPVGVRRSGRLGTTAATDATGCC